MNKIGDASAGSSRWPRVIKFHILATNMLFNGKSHRANSKSIFCIFGDGGERGESICVGPPSIAGVGGVILTHPIQILYRIFKGLKSDL